MNPTHRHKPTAALVFPEGYESAELENLPKGFWAEADKEFRLAEVRALRDRLLAESDPMLLPDRGLSESALKSWTDYRRALRDITQGDPFNPEWPAKPDRS